MNDTLSFDLLDIVKTKEDRIQFLSQLDALTHAFFSHEKEAMSILDQTISYKSKEKLLQIAQQNKISITDEQAFQSFIETVKQTVSEFPEVTITLAFAPTQEVITVISGWFSVHAKKAMILDIAVDKSLIGGVIIGFNGMYKDFSLKKKLQDKYERGEMKLMSSG